MLLLVNNLLQTVLEASMELRLEDFFIKCRECTGTGWVEPRREGTHNSVTYGGTCRQCGGPGGTLTANGEVIAELMGFLRKHNRL